MTRAAGDYSLDETERMNKALQESLAKLHPEREAQFADPTEDINLFLEQVPGKRMLDVGCGSARFVNRFIEAGMQYAGIDLSPSMVQMARKRHPGLFFFEQSYRHMHFPDESFEGLWSCCVINHEPKANMPAALAEHRRVLVTGGILLIVLPDLSDSFEYVGRVEESVEEEAFLAGWHLDELAAVGESVQFRILQKLYRVYDGSMTLLMQK